MRRGPGIAGLQQAARAREVARNTGDEVKKSNLQAMKEHMTKFRGNLEEFARKYRNDIRKDPVFRAQFQTMCANIGVDPLASNKGAWAQLLGFGDYYYELGVQVAEACWATRQYNGGIIEFGTLLKFVNRRRGAVAEPASEDDVLRAIKKLAVLGNGFDVFTVGKVTYVRSVPGELNMDRNKILELAQEKGVISKKEITDQTKWPVSRVEDALVGLLKDGQCLVDDQAPNRERLYWFPFFNATM